MKECEHELNCIDENWITDNVCYVTFTCNKCEDKFIGVIYKEDQDGKK